MKKIYTYVVWASFALGVAVLINEFINCRIINGHINRNEPFLPKDSHTFQIAEGNSNFAASQHKASSRRISSIPSDIIKHITVLAVSFIILNENIKTSFEVFIGKAIEACPKIGRSSMLKEVSFVSVTITLLLAALFSGNPIFFKPTKGESMIPISIMVYLSLCFIFIPCIYIVISKLLKVYSSRLIAACYLAYFVKSISEFVTVDDIDLGTMKKINISEFSSEVVDYLKERKLENRVYAEKKKSETLNAALVGWGSLERIEIYGDHKNLTDREFESVLMHEIGHSQDYSLFKKLGVLFTVKLIEMAVLLYLFIYFSEEYSDEFISKHASFCILSVIYFLFISRWLLLFHKLTSQTAENSADLIAKAHGYGVELSKVLFDITVKGETSIRSTWIFNAIRSYHPTVYERIERLNS